MDHHRTLRTHRLHRLPRLALLLGLLLLMVLVWSPPVRAASFSVTSTADSGPGSLREALALASASPGSDAITFQLTGCPCTITLASELVTPAGTVVTITGPGAEQLRLSGNEAVRVLRVEPGAWLALHGLTIAAGLTQDPDAPFGAGIYNDGGTLTLSHSVVRDHAIVGTGVGGFGGGIYNSGGTLTLINSAVSDNEIASGGRGDGGGIYNSFGGTVTLLYSTVSGNTARTGGGIYNNTADGGTLTLFASAVRDNTAAVGGGIYNAGGGLLTLTNSTVSENDTAGVGGDGGGIFNNGGPLTLINSTVSGNAAANGGGLRNGGGTVTLANSTISENVASFNGGGIYHTYGGTVTLSNSTVADNSAASGGGLYVSGGGVLTLTNTIVAYSAAGGECQSAGGTVTDGGHNLVEDNSCGFTGGQDPLLGPLTDNGGPTPTHALLAGSPALEAGDDAVCGAAPVNGRDQRGVARPQGTHCDLGAFELGSELGAVLQFSAPTFSVAENGGSAVITVTRSGDSTAVVSVTAATTSGGSDFTAVSAVLSWASGDLTPKTLTIAIINDLADETDETVQIILSGPTGSATLGLVSAAILTITDDDAPPPPYATAVMTDSPAAYWRLDEASGMVAQDLTTVNPGSYQNGVTLGTPHALPDETTATGVTLDGVDDFVRVPDSASLSPTAAVTVETWVQLASYSGSYPRLVSKPGAYELTMFTYAGGEGRLEWKLTLEGGAVAVTTAYADRLALHQWTYVAATYDGANLRIYLNGRQRAIKPTTGAIKDSTAPLTIGMNTATRVPAAAFDETAVYGTALAAVRLLAHYETAVPPVPDTPYVAAVRADGPAAYWRLNEASGVAAADRSGNENTGTYTNGATQGAPGALTSESDAAVQFDGVDDFVRVPDSASLSPTAAVTVETWVQLASYSGSYPRLVSKPGAYELTMFTYAGGEGRLEWKLTLEGGAVAVTTAYADRLALHQWTYVAATYDGANLRIYLNGVQKAVKVASGAVKDSAAVLTISQLDRPVMAKLDEVAVYGAALSPNRILAHYTTR